MFRARYDPFHHVFPFRSSVEINNLTSIIIVHSKTTKKPSHDFYIAFKKSYPDLGPGTANILPSTTLSDNSLSLATAAGDQTMDQRYEAASN